MERFIRVDGTIVKMTEDCVDDFANVITDIYDWCQCYGECGWNACKMIAEEFFKAKKDIINTLSKHPNWNEDKMAVIMNQDIARKFDKEVYIEFLSLMWAWAHEDLKTREVKVGEYTYSQLQSKVSKLRDDIYHMEFLREYDEIESLYDKTVEEKDRLSEMKTDAYYNDDYKCDGNYLYLRSDWEKTDNVERIFEYLKTVPEQFISKGTEMYINNIIPEFKAKEGQKVSRVVNKLCKMLGLTEMTNEKLNVIHMGYGNYEPEKNIYNIKYAEFADACNPFSVTKRTFFSVHPIDFLTMSWGTNWSTCMTPDKDDRHKYGSSTGASYRGCYSSGVLSYLLDGSTVVFYTLNDNAEKIQEDLKEPTPRKEMRQLFHIGKEKFIQGRLYPYDQTDKGNHAEPEDYVQYRQIVQNILATCWDIPNLWQPNKRGTSACCDEATTKGTHYVDYGHYANCNISFIKEYNGTEKIVIGHNPICPSCGNEHTIEDNGFCPSCRGEEDNEGLEWCEYHQEWEDPDEENMCYIEDYGYVCESGRDSGDFGYCDRCGEWFYNPYGDSGVYSSRDEREYCCERCAEREGYYYNNCAEDYLHEDDTEYSEIDGEDLPNFDLERYGLVYAIYNEDEDETIAYESSCFEYEGRWYDKDLEVVIDGESYPEWLTEENLRTGEMMPTVDVNDIDDDGDCDYCYAYYNNDNEVTIERVGDCEFINGYWYSREICHYIETEGVWVTNQTYLSCYNLRGFIDVDGIMTRINMMEMYEVA